jgi:hypothetical protein
MHFFHGLPLCQKIVNAYIPCIGSTMHCCQMSKDSKADAGHVDFLIRTKLIGLYLKMDCNDVHFQILSFLETLGRD